MYSKSNTCIVYRQIQGHAEYLEPARDQKEETPPQGPYINEQLTKPNPGYRSNQLKPSRKQHGETRQVYTIL